MRDAQIAERVTPLTGRMAATAQVSVTPAEPAFRLSLRARPDAVARFVESPRRFAAGEAENIRDQRHAHGVVARAG